MALTATIIATGVSISIGIIAIVQQSQTVSDGSNYYWYDFLHNYYTFHESFTDQIDLLLITKATNNKMINEFNLTVPDDGTYTIVINGYKFHLIKETVMIDSNKYRQRYRIYFFKLEKNQDKLLKSFFSYLNMYIHGDSVQYFSIDTSDHIPKVIQDNKICYEPKPNQEEALNLILNGWRNNSNKNLKVLVVGFKGLGKTYLGALLKKSMDDDILNTFLFDDFDPSTIGVNIKVMVLQKATVSTPVILMINEIDKVFEKVLDNTPSFDPRIQHTKSFESFNNMLDSIGNKKNIIAIYTCEDIEIKNKPEYSSFIRKGRVDMTIHLTEFSARIL